MTRMTTDIDALSQLLQTGLVTSARQPRHASSASVVVLVFMSSQLALVAAPDPAAADRRDALVPRVGRAGPTRRPASASPRSTPTCRRASRACASRRRSCARTATSTRSATSPAATCDARLGAQRLVAIYFPFVAVPRRPRRRRSCSGVGSVLVARRRRHRRAADRVPAVPRPVLRADPAALAGVRLVPAGAASHGQDQRAARHADAHARSPVDPVVARARLRRRRRASTDVRFALPEHRRRRRLRGVDLRRRAGRDGRARRRDRRGQVDGREAGRPLLRRRPAGGVLRRRRRRVTELDLVAFRHQLGVVPQEAFLFSGTIRDNIAYGRPDATDAEVEAAARAVGAHDFIAGAARRLPAAGERAGPVAVVGAAPAHRLGPGPPRRPGDPAARRGDRRTSTSTPRPGCSRAMGVAAPGPHHDPHRAPAPDRPPRRPHRRDRRRPRRRGRATTTSCSPPAAPTPTCWRSFAPDEVPGPVPAR